MECDERKDEGLTLSSTRPKSRSQYRVYESDVGIRLLVSAPHLKLPLSVPFSPSPRETDVVVNGTKLVPRERHHHHRLVYERKNIEHLSNNSDAEDVIFCCEDLSYSKDDIFQFQGVDHIQGFQLLENGLVISTIPRYRACRLGASRFLECQ